MQDLKHIDIPSALYCKIKNISQRTLYRWIKDKKISVRKQKNTFFVRLEENEIYIIDKEEVSRLRNVKLVNRSKEEILVELKCLKKKIDSIISTMEKQ